MREKKHRSRGSRLDPEQRTFIELKLEKEGLSVKATAERCGVSEGSIRNALDGKPLDYSTHEAILDKLGVPDVNKLKQDHIRLFNTSRERNRYFIGREDKIEAIRVALQDAHCAAVTQALSGLGGMGKTATAIEYAYRCLDKARYPDYPRYKAIQFARADTTDVLKDGYANIANALQLPMADPNNREEAVRAVIRWMAQPENAPWLLILDNLDDDPDRVKEFLPKAPLRHYGHVLITSRSHRVAGRVERVDIDAIDEEEGVTFLYNRTERVRMPGSNEEHAAEALVAEMGGLPLALEQAGAYMTSWKEISFEDYLTSFRSERMCSEQMNYSPEYGFYEFTVRTTWQMSLDKIKPHHPEAVDVLQLCAFLHPVGIPRELVFALLPDYFAPTGEGVVEQNELYNSLLDVLTGYSLIQRDLNNNTHSLHILVQAMLRDGQSPEEQKRAYERILTSIAGSFSSDDYVLDGRGALYYSHAERIRTQVELCGTESAPVSLLFSRMGV